MPCFRFSGQGVHNNSYYEFFACGVNAYFSFNGSGYSLMVDGNNVAGLGYEYRKGTTQLQVVTNSSFTPGVLSGGTCAGCPSYDKKYDCVNGECYDSALYNTPGSFATLADCNAACGGGGENCPPGMICLDAAEFSQIEELSAALKDSVC